MITDEVILWQVVQLSLIIFQTDAYQTSMNWKLIVQQTITITYSVLVQDFIIQAKKIEAHELKKKNKWMLADVVSLWQKVQLTSLIIQTATYNTLNNDNEPVIDDSA